MTNCLCLLTMEIVTMKKIYIVRHGQSHTNAGGKAMPNAEIPLTELGQQQAVSVADWLLQATNKNICSIGVSKYLRTQQTAQPLVEKTALTPTIIEGLQEFNYLCFETIKGKTVEERMQIAERYWLKQAPDFIDGGDDTQAENFAMFVQRTQKVLTQLQRLEDGIHVLYSHGLWISMLIWIILAQPTDNNEAMQKFRQFELSIRAKNCEVFLLTLQKDCLPAMTKVRSVC